MGESGSDPSSFWEVVKESACGDLGGVGEVGSAAEEEGGDANLLDQEDATAGWEEGVEQEAGRGEGDLREEGEVAAGTEEVVCVRTGEEGEAETEVSSSSP